MFVEIHLIQNFSPSNLNRDDTNTPKDCEFGAVRRARISSQCFKRAVRNYFNSSQKFSNEELAVRTKRIAEAVFNHLNKSETIHSQEDISKACENLLAGCKIKIEDGMSQYLLFLGAKEIAGLAEIINKNITVLLGVKTESPPADDKKKTTSKEAKKAKKASIPAELVKEVSSILSGGKAADLALFGRLITDLPEKSIEASCQVAHAISTHRVAMETDYFTAIDDLQPADLSGAGMLGTVDFNSSCFYRYAVLDTVHLARNLGGDKELTLKTSEEFIKAMINAIPSGKQNSMAAHNLPSAILIIARTSGQWSLANAFEKPIRPDTTSSLIQGSVEGLIKYYSQLESMFGKDQINSAQLCCIDKEFAKNLNIGGAISLVNTVQELLENLKALISKGK